MNKKLRNLTLPYVFAFRGPLRILFIYSSIIILIVTLIFYIIWKSSEMELNTELHSSHYADVSNHEHHFQKIIRVTGKSYEAKFGNIKIYICPPNQLAIPEPKKILWNNKMWQQVTISNPDKSSRAIGVYLYSAYYDTRLCKLFGREKHCFVRLLAMLDGESVNGKYYCQIWYSILNSNRSIIVDAQLQEIWTSEWDSSTASNVKQYKPYLLSCTLPKKYSLLKIIPNLVSVSTRPCGNASNIFSLSPPPQPIRNSSTTSFAVCVKPLDFDKDLSLQLVEWLELNFILGASQIDIYTFRVHPNVNAVLEYYQTSGKSVRVIPMSLPGYQPNFPIERSQFLRRNLWQKRRNELIPYNDCLYRSLVNYDYIIPLDIDEILVPKQHETWVDLFEHLEKTDASMLKSYASFSVRNAYFLESFNDAEKEDADKTPQKLYFLKHLYRSANFSDANRSVKSFVRTDKSLTVFNHYALESVIPGIGRSTNLPVELIQMNHYRKSCPNTMSQECKHNFLKFKILDTIVMKYQSELGKRTKEVLEKLNLKQTF